MINDSDRQILEEILDIQGQCLDVDRCNKCVLKKTCFRRWLTPRPPSSQLRARIALDLLTRDSLMDDLGSGTKIIEIIEQLFNTQ